MLLTETFSAMTHKSPNMNDILSTSVGIGGGTGAGGGIGPGGMLGHLSNDSHSRNQNQSIPMVRSMSDASDFARRPFPFDFDITSRLQYGLASPGSRMGGMMSSNLYGIPGATSSSSSSNANSSTTTNSIDFAPSVITPKFLPNSTNHNHNHNHSAGTDPEDEDFDLYMVFDEIGALQNKGLDESEDDSSEIPFSTSLTNSGSSGVTNSQPSASQMQQPQQQQQQQQQQQIVSSAATASTTTCGTITNHQSSAAQMHSASTASSATKTYNPEIYDETDIKLSNEKYVLNVRYLKDFRCEQCPLFLQHKCTQHKPFTCFHWHFANQRRRRPLRKRDGTFNYSPDVYCTKYDETTGICPDGDDCPYLHRTAGDTERRYHLRYYKTGMCVYETDNRGFCVKNGPHCAFAHGQHDLRLPVFDVREQSQLSDGGDGADGVGLNGGHGTGAGSGGNGGGCFDKDRNAVNEDPRWQDTAFVLANYKTELCKRPPRLCRQGYACPQYHNNKDRRRSPKKFKYRSTPCPNVKQGDEWGDPTNCENEDSCSCCHTRTEQQFHPEIYKSTKCNDIQQSNYCPRGPFCAFAHSESSEEINAAREFSMDPNSDIPSSITGKNGGMNGSASSNASHNNSGNNNNNSNNANSNSNLNNNNNHRHHTSPVDISRANSLSAYSRSNAIAMQSIASSLPEHFDFGNFDLSAPQPPLAMAQHEAAMNSALCNNNNSTNSIGPIARPRSFSTSNTKAVEPMSLSSLLEKNNLLKSKVSGANAMGSTLFSVTSSTSSLFSGLPEHPSQLSSSFGASGGGGSGSSMQQQQQQSQNFYGLGGSESLSNPFDSVLEDLNLEEFGTSNNLTSSVVDNHLGSVGSVDAVSNNNSALNSMLRRSSMLSECSAPINIPVNRIGSSLADARSNSATGFNISPPLPGSENSLGTSSPMGSSFGTGGGSNSFRAGCRPLNLSQATGQSIVTAQNFFDSLTGGPHPAVPASAVNLNSNFVQATMAEMQRLREENSIQKSTLASYEEKLSSLVSLCQREINEANQNKKMAEKARDEAINLFNSTQQELELLRSSESNLIQKRLSDINSMSRSQLIQLQQKIKKELNCVEEVFYYREQQQQQQSQ